MPSRLEAAKRDLVKVLNQLASKFAVVCKKSTLDLVAASGVAKIPKRPISPKSLLGDVRRNVFFSFIIPDLEILSHSISWQNV